MQLYFVRHGESEANVLQVFSNNEVSHGLTALGRAQISALAETLADVPFAAFYSSPVLRARQSADILSARLGLEYSTTSALTEYNVGELEGRSDAASWQRQAALHDAWFRAQDWGARLPGGGESFDDIRARFVPLIESLQADPPPGPVVLLGHGGTFRCMLPVILSNVTFDWATEHGMANAGVVIAEQRPEGLVCVQWGQYAGLQFEATRHQE